MSTIARVLSFVSLAAGGLTFYRAVTYLESPILGWLSYVTAPVLGIPKLLAGVYAPQVAVVGALGAILGLLTAYRDRTAMRELAQSRGARARLGLAAGAPLTVAAGVAGALICAAWVRDAAAPHDGFARAFGADWQSSIPPAQASRLVQQRWAWQVPEVPEPRWERDVAFWTIPGSDRQLLADLWLPPTGTARSGLAFIYFHGGGWHYLDKDTNTRPLFRQLTAQGHVVMDVANRLCPETDARGQVHDAKRAIAWLKQHAEGLGVDPRKIVVGGGSSGGNLALLAAYAPDQPELTPEELKGTDLAVRAVVSYYGPTDLWAYDQRGEASVAPDRPVLLGQLISLGLRATGAPTSFDPLSHRRMMTNLLGGRPEDVPDEASLVSPVSYVGPSCPPTLLFQGEHDSTTPVDAVRTLYRKLLGVGVPVVYVEYPRTEHAFDVWFPGAHSSPPAQAALYDVERFLALMALDR